MRLFLMLGLWLIAMAAVLFFLKWFIPAFGDAGYIVWMLGAFGIAAWLHSKDRAAQ